jgi:hypothetical protein
MNVNKNNIKHFYYFFNLFPNAHAAVTGVMRTTIPWALEHKSARRRLCGAAVLPLDGDLTDR